MRSQNSASTRPHRVSEQANRSAQSLDAPEIREMGAPINGEPQYSARRLFLQLQVFTGCAQPHELIESLKASSLEVVLYHDLNDPKGVGLLFMTEDAEALVTETRRILTSPPFNALHPKPEFTMVGRTYASGREPDLEDWLLVKPRRNTLNPDLSWAIWYPLRRKPEFYRLPPQEQGKILMEHAMIGRTYVEAGYAHDIRLACFGLDARDNDFVIGLMGTTLHPLSHLVGEMRKSQQTAQYLESLGPFLSAKFAGKVLVILCEGKNEKYRCNRYEGIVYLLCLTYRLFRIFYFYSGLRVPILCDSGKFRRVSVLND